MIVFFPGCKTNDSIILMMKKNTWFWLALPLILAAITSFTYSCRKCESDESLQIKVGVLLGFTGTGSQNALETQTALELGVEDARAYFQRNGINATIELIFRDTKSDTTEAKLQAQSLYQEGVRLIIGPYTSAESRAVVGLNEMKNILVVSHSAVSTSLAIPDDNFLRFVPSDTYQAEAVNAMFTLDSVAVIMPVIRNDLWSNSLDGATHARFVGNGGIMFARQTFEPGTTDFSGIADNVRKVIEQGLNTYKPNQLGVYLVSYSDGTGFLEAMSRAGLADGVRVYGASAFAQSAALLSNPVAAEFAVQRQLQCPVFGYNEEAAGIYEPIQQRIVAKIGTRASIYALAAYDILWVAMLTAITQETNPDFDAFKAHFIETAGDYFGATGRTELDGNGDRKHVFYDFWTVRKVNGVYTWQVSAKYSTSDHLIRRTSF